VLGFVTRDEAVPIEVRRRQPIGPGPAQTALKGIASKLRGVGWNS
jgi:hypothetical protein